MAVFGNTRFWGSALILAGTAIGAGMLALPLVSAKIGFFPMLFIFFVTAFFMAYSALLMFEANLVIGKGSSLYVMACQTLGRPGKAIATFAPLGLFYSLMAAYLAGGGGLIHALGKALFSAEISTQLGVVIFAVIAGCIVFYSTRAVDYINRVLFLLMLLVFCAAFVCLVPSVEYSHLSTYRLSGGQMWIALPIIFTSFGYHGSIPSVILYERDNVSQLPRAFVLGTVLSLVFYVIWLAVSVGSLSGEALEHISHSDGSIGELVVQLSRVAGSHGKVDTFLFAFSDLALLTSVLGVALGLFDYLASLFQREDSFKGRSQTALLTFLPPVLLALFYPDGFVIALGYAAIALSMLAVLLPVAIVWHLRKKGMTGSYRAPGGFGLLIVCFLFGVAVIASQLIAIIMLW